MSTVTENTRDTYAAIVTAEPELFGAGKLIATLFAMLLIGAMLSVMTQGWWGPLVGR